MLAYGTRKEVIRMPYVNVPVPEDRVPEVYALLAQPRTAETQGNGWSRDEMVRAYRESSAAMKRVFEHLADRPGQEVGADELSSAVGVTRPQLAGVLGAAGRRFANRYKKTAWPFEAQWISDAGMVVYEMTSDVADAIREARS
jgi:hypothetical protein